MFIFTFWYEYHGYPMEIVVLAENEQRAKELVFEDFLANGERINIDNVETMESFSLDSERVVNISYIKEQ